MQSATNLFSLECRDGTVIVTPMEDLSEFQFRELTRQATQAFDELETLDIRKVVVDFRNTDYFGSTALGLFVQLWSRICGKGGRLAFCNLSDREQQILTITHLDSKWPLCENLEDALQAVNSSESHE